MTIDEYAARLTDRNGFYDVADLSAAGFSPSEIMEYEAAAARSAGPMTPVGDGSVVSPNVLQRRERHAQALARLFGGEDYDRGDLRRAQSFTGTTDPSATFADSFGLADITPMAALYGIEEGADTAARGYGDGDYLTMGMGAGEMALGLLEAVPGVGALAKGAGRGLDSAFARQADRFVQDYTPTSPPTSPSAREFFFVPTEAEADELRGIGREIQSYPMVNAGGDALGFRPYTSSNQAEYEALRPDFDLSDIEVNYASRLPNNASGVARYRSMDIADYLSEAETANTINHELKHVLDFESGLPIEEIGGRDDPSNRAFLLQELRNRIMAPGSLEEFSKSIRAYRALSRTTPNEMYYNTPGEIIARASEGDDRSVARLTALQTLNPHLNPESSAFQRASKAIGTGIFSSRGLLRSQPGRAGDDLRKALPKIDTYVSVPSDYDRAMIPSLAPGVGGRPGMQYASPSGPDQYLRDLDLAPDDLSDALTLFEPDEWDGLDFDDF